VEKSLDADAKKIQIEISGAGLLLIRVSDDGRGMEEKNLKMALVRHATSKIKSLKDLHKVLTMGFRGEALASIASISKMKIESAFDNVGYCISNENPNLERVSRKVGTQVEVRSLFYNVPVRKKFQKSLGALTAEIIKVVHSLALANPFVAFSLSVSDKKILDVKGDSSLDFKTAFTLRVKEVLGSSSLAGLHYVEAFDAPLKIQGFLGDANFIKSNKKSQFLMVNQRTVYSHMVSEAIKEGYGTRIAENDYPVFILNLFIDSSLIDVNVHPQKKQIRFCEEDFIRDRLHKIVEKTFEKEAKVVISAPCFQKEANFSHVDSSFSFESFKEVELFSDQKVKNEIREIAIFNEYFLYEFLAFEEKKLMVVDLKAASSHLLFEDALKAIENKTEPQLQNFSFPIIFDLLKEEVVLIENNLKNLLLLGLEIRVVGEKTIAIDSASPYLISENMKNLVSSILEEIELFGKTEKQKAVFEKKLAQKICRFAKSRKKSYTMEEAKAILSRLDKNKKINFDPLGERIMIELAEDDLAKLFSNKRGEACRISKE
jgi:DNA mismatch repair protein MutL